MIDEKFIEWAQIETVPVDLESVTIKTKVSETSCLPILERLIGLKAYLTLTEDAKRQKRKADLFWEDAIGRHIYPWVYEKAETFEKDGTLFIRLSGEESETVFAFRHPETFKDRINFMLDQCEKRKERQKERKL